MDDPASAAKAEASGQAPRGTPGGNLGAEGFCVRARQPGDSR